MFMANKKKNVKKSGKQEKPKKGEKKEKEALGTIKAEKKTKLTSEGIVRIINTDVSAALPLSRALYDIKGVGLRYNLAIAKVFEEQTKIPPTTPIGKLTEEQLELLEDITRNPTKYGIPKWFVNKPADLWDGTAKHLLGGDLIFNDKEELDRLAKVRHRKAIRRLKGLPVRGQKTKAGFRHRGTVVGVIKSK